MRKKLVSFIYACSYAVLASVNYSCATLTIEELPEQPIQSYENKKVIDGLTIAIQPISNSTDCKKYFGIDLISEGVIPILIIAKNKHQTHNYTIFKEKISINTAKGETNDANEPGENKIESKENVGSALTGTAAALTAGAVFVPVIALAAAPVLMISGAKQLSDGTIIKHNLASKEFYTETISNGETTSGFVYIQIPKGDELLDSIGMTINAEEMSENLNYDYKFTISITGGKG